MTQTIEQLTARVRELEDQYELAANLANTSMDRVRELEEENARLQALMDFDNKRLDQIEDELEDVEYLGPYVEGIKLLKTQLAASQLHAKQLREALENHSGNYKLSKAECKIINDLLDKPHDTSALDAYVAENVKEIIESHAPDGRNVTNAQHVEMRHKFVEQIATLTRQRDLAVEALEWACGEKPNDKGKWFDAPDGAPKYWWRTELRKALSTIKESEGK